MNAGRSTGRSSEARCTAAGPWQRLLTRWGRCCCLFLKGRPDLQTHTTAPPFHKWLYRHLLCWAAANTLGTAGACAQWQAPHFIASGHTRQHTWLRQRALHQVWIEPSRHWKLTPAAMVVAGGCTGAGPHIKGMRISVLFRAGSTDPAAAEAEPLGKRAGLARAKSLTVTPYLQGAGSESLR